MAGEPVTAVVVTHDSAEVLPACLAALAREGLSVLVVDNASTDGTPELAELLGAAVIRNAMNEGYGRANNRGVRTATSDLVLILNPDVALDAGSAAELFAAAKRYPDAAVFAPRIVEEDGRFFFQPRSLIAPYLHNTQGAACRPEGDCCTPFLSGAALLVKRDVFVALGGFDESIFLFYEDDDLCRRVADAGHALVHVHQAVARHGRGRSTREKRGRIFRSRWHQAWSRAYVSAKYALPSPAPVMFLQNALKAVGAAATLNLKRFERYAGSAAGALAAMCGRSALAREGLTRKKGT